MNIGDPAQYDFEIPPHMLDAVQGGLEKSGNYADSMGLMEAREAIAKEYPSCSTNDVTITNGGSEGIFRSKHEDLRKSS